MVRVLFFNFIVLLSFGSESYAYIPTHETVSAEYAKTEISKIKEIHVLPKTKNNVALFNEKEYHFDLKKIDGAIKNSFQNYIAKEKLFSETQMKFENKEDENLEENILSLTFHYDLNIVEINNQKALLATLKFRPNFTCSKCSIVKKIAVDYFLYERFFERSLNKPFLITENIETLKVHEADHDAELFMIEKPDLILIENISSKAKDILEKQIQRIVTFFK